MPVTRKVWEFMVREPRTLRPDQTLLEAIVALSDLQKEIPGARTMIVVDEAGNLEGLVTMRRIVKNLRGVMWGLSYDDTRISDREFITEQVVAETRRRKVKQVMAKKVLTVKPHQPVTEAVEAMVENDVASVPVVEGRKVIGVVRLPDVFVGFAGLFKQFA